MKRMKLIGLSLLAIFALGAFAVASASAEEGFLPLKVKTATALGGESTLSSGGIADIVCKELDDSTITFTNDKTASGTLHWLGCKAGGLFAAKSLGASGSEEILAPTKFLVCLDAKNGTTLVDNFGVAGTVEKLHLEVPGLGILAIVNGTALGAILTAGPAKLWSMEFIGKKGVQTITSCKQGETTITHNLTSAENEGTPAAASENVVGGLLQFTEEQKLEDS
jgi:hypothetical protein